MLALVGADFVRFCLTRAQFNWTILEPENRQDRFNFPYQVGCALFSEWPFATLPLWTKTLRGGAGFDHLNTEPRSRACCQIWTRGYLVNTSVIRKGEKFGSRISEAASHCRQSERNEVEHISYLIGNNLTDKPDVFGGILFPTVVGKHSDFTNVEDVSKNVLDDFSIMRKSSKH